MTAGLVGVSLPKNWQWSQLRHLTINLRRGTSPDYVDDGPIKVINQACNQPGGLDWSRIKFHGYNGDSRSLKGYLQPNDVLVNSTGTGTLGRVGYFRPEEDSGHCIADSHVTVIRTDSTQYDSRYAYYYLLCSQFQHYMMSALVTGSTNQIELNPDRLGSAPAPVPPLEEQRRIADFLDAEISRINQLFALKSRQIKLNHQRVSSSRDILLDQLYRKYGSAPFRRFVQSIEQGVSPEASSYPAAADEPAVLKLSSVKQGRFFSGENKAIYDSHEWNTKISVKRNDFLITRANTPDLVGDTAVVEETEENRLLPDLIYRIGLSSEVSPYFANEVSLGSRVRSVVAATARGSSQSMVKLRGEDIKNWPIPNVSLATQENFCKEISGRRRKDDQLSSFLNTQLDLLAERKQALITAAVTGQIDVTTAGRATSDLQA